MAVVNARASDPTVVVDATRNTQRPPGFLANAPVEIVHFAASPKEGAALNVWCVI